ncbi:MAG: hypothetical protein M0Q23_05160 [Syntrophales bacterium]|jgi:hypothetical protein|nr:hypothetical protein [Syntrophales bacterium]MCK9528030.1 hypothetical protein [Syntrophales bacterium]MDX9921393.1 hypothetical protein [Syntrophales bacterium]
MSTQTIIILFVAAVVVVVLVKGLGGGRYGRLLPAGNVAERYETFRVDPEKQYYTSGPDSCPNALMGINRSWSLEGGLWKKRDLTESAMKNLVLDMQRKALDHTTVLHGFDVLDDRGWKIGDWYSVMGLDITIRIRGEKRVSITTPFPRNR